MAQWWPLIGVFSFFILGAAHLFFSFILLNYPRAGPPPQKWWPHTLRLQQIEALFFFAGPAGASTFCKVVAPKKQPSNMLKGRFLPFGASGPPKKVNSTPIFEITALLYALHFSYIFNAHMF